MNNWEEFIAAEFCASVRDGTHDSPKRAEKGEYLITSRHIVGNRIDLSNAYQISYDDYVEVNRRSKVDRWDVLVTMIGTVGEAVLVSEEPNFAIKNIGLFKSKSELKGRWLYYFLRSPSAKRSIAARRAGTTQAYISLGELRTFPIPWPGKAKASAIVAILSALDDKIELNRQMNETLEASARALFRDWFVDFGPTKAKMAGDAPYLAPDLWALFPDKLDDDLIPMGWLAAQISDLIDFNPREKLSKGTKAPYIDMSSLPVVGSTVETPTVREFKSGSKFRVNDALMARITPCLENGKTGYVDTLTENDVGWGSTEFFVLRSRRPVPPAFAYLIARDPNFRATAIRSMSGTSGRQRASKDALETYPFVKPSSDAVWNAFGDIIAPIFSRIKANGEENRTLAQTRDLLLPKLMSGEIRIRDAEQTVSKAV